MTDGWRLSAETELHPKLGAPAHHLLRSAMVSCPRPVLVVLLLAIAAVHQASAARSRFPSDPAGGGYHLFIDETVVQDRGNTAPSLGPVHKSEANPLLREDRRWEGSWKNTNPSVVYKDGLFHLWMTANLVCPGAPSTNK